MLKYTLLFLLALSCAHKAPQKTNTKPIQKYVRADWPHWIDEDKNCRNTRQEILISRSEKTTKMNKKGCTVVSGLWDDYYYPEKHTLAKKVDIDHLIPLKHAHENGGAHWTTKQKQNFANDPENLVITNRSYNRQKGAKGIDQWLPVHHQYACRYIKDWMRLKKKYQLVITKQEQHTITNSNCP